MNIKAAMARLEINAGKLTLMEIVHDRELAINTIDDLLEEIERLKAKKTSVPVPEEKEQPMMLSVNQICEQFNVARSTVYRWVQEGQFPKSVLIGPNTARWRTQEVLDWAADRNRLS